MRQTVDIVCINNAGNFGWQHGTVYYTKDSVADVCNVITIVQKQSKAEWVLFWDCSLGIINEDLIATLIESKTDIWHAGLKMGLTGLPDVINYVNPAWIYNKDASSEIINSSFRIGLRACLIKKDVLKAIADLSFVAYKSIEMIGLAMGYALIKKGAIIRYHPDLIGQYSKQTSIPEIDEWIFTKQFFPKKWRWWIALNKKGLFRNIQLLARLNDIKTYSISPDIYSAQTNIEALYKTVSVLAPTLDRYSYLHNELDQLAVQTIKPVEILITDQTDEAKRMQLDESRFQGLTVRYFPQSEKGQCIAWNKLLEEAKGEYVLFLGDDADNITAGFIQKLLSTAQYFDADIVASNVIEIGMPPKPINKYYYMSDTFPITLAKRDVIENAGNMDMFFNKNIRADYDLALRCHQNGALMVFDSAAVIDHHRAPVGGLRTYKARAITNRISKNSITRFAEPTSSEMFLVKKHFNKKQYNNYIRIKYFDQLVVNGSVLKKALRVLVFIYKLPGFIKRYKKNLATANAELQNRGLLNY